ncbi:MAG: hypothetical protein ACO3IN_13470 [Steroidobacteraceae bacterium]
MDEIGMVPLDGDVRGLTRFFVQRPNVPASLVDKAFRVIFELGVSDETSPAGNAVNAKLIRAEHLVSGQSRTCLSPGFHFQPTGIPAAAAPQGLVSVGSIGRKMGNVPEQRLKHYGGQSRETFHCFGYRRA